MLLKKAARCQPFLAVVRCLFYNHLRLKRSSLLNVYLNYKFEISLLTSHLFFSLFILVFLRKRRRWAFSLNKYASGLGSTNLCEGFFGLIYPTKRIFEPTVLLLKKTARCQPFLAVVRCLFHNHLRLKRSSLLNVYLNCKFEISLLTSHLFYRLFNHLYDNFPGILEICLTLFFVLVKKS